MPAVARAVAPIPARLDRCPRCGGRMVVHQRSARRLVLACYPCAEYRPLIHRDELAARQQRAEAGRRDAQAREALLDSRLRARRERVRELAGFD